MILPIIQSVILEKTLLELKDKVNLFAYSNSFSETELTKVIKKYFVKWNTILGKNQKIS